MLELEKHYINEMITHAQEEAPNECCGILVGKDGRAVRLYRMTNVEGSPYRYKMDSGEQYQIDKEIANRGWEVLAFYHSHTHSEAYPSPTDVRMATWADTRESIWPNVFYILVSLMDNQNPAVRAFHIQDGGEITEHELRATS